MRLAAGSVQDVLAGGNPKGVAFIDLDFASGMVRVTDCNADLELTSEGNTYQGLGELIAMEVPAESDSSEVHGGSLVLAGVAANDLERALEERVRGRPITMRFGIMDETFGIVATPTEFIGVLDHFKWKRKRNSSLLELAFESETAAARRPKIRRFTQEDQQREYPNDNHLRHLNRMKQFVVIFPTAEAQRR